jgi:hypothetical protein
MPKLSLTLALGAAVIAAPAAAQQPTAMAAPAPEHHMMKMSHGLSSLTPLAGEWEGQTLDGKPVHLSYRVVSGGSALLERLQMGTEAEMVTVYAPDGDKVTVTHFCSAGNQPQMTTGPITSDVKELAFTFVRATNLGSATEGHMHNLTLKLTDPTHLTQEWTWQENGQSRTMAFQFTRKS